jgi:hypothetical protein
MTHVRWMREGEARFIALRDDAVVLRSTVSSPPGSCLEGALQEPPVVKVRVKVHSSKRQAEGDFVIEGRLIDARRDVRARLERLVAGAT